MLDIMAKHQVIEGIKMSFELVVDLVYFAMLNNCLRKNTDPDFTYVEVNDWVDDAPMSKMLEIFEAFKTSFTVEEQENTPVKKTGAKKVSAPKK